MINLSYGDGVQFTVEIENTDAAITFILELVPREVNYGGGPVKEGMLGEVLIALRLKERRFYPKGSRVIPSGLKELTVTDEFCDALKVSVTDLLLRSLENESLKLR